MQEYFGEWVATSISGGNGEIPVCHGFPVRGAAELAHGGENVGLYLTEHRLKAPEEIGRIVSESLEAVGLKGTKIECPANYQVA